MTVLVLALAALLAACSNTPPPPVVSSPVAQTSRPPVEAPSQIVVALDDIVGGYNPHNLADASTVTSALSQLLLPSVFRPAENGELVLDESLMVSAEVTERDPFTVTYRIRPDASWSDGAPIAVEDFVYLAEAMKTQPGVVTPAGYELISQITPGEGGKLVEVTFSEPYPGWKTLFDNLLPAHLLKDAPGGWQGALADSFPAYGGPFAIKTIDTARGEIVLERNERYWEKPAAVDRIVLRRSDAQNTVAGLRTGNDQFALVSAGAATRDLLADLGEDVRLHTVARPYVAEVLLRPVGPALAEDDVRAAIAALIDRDALIEAGTQGGASADLRASAHVLPPSSGEYKHTIPGAGPPLEPDPKRAGELLAEAGYEREAGSWVRDGRTLSVVVAAPGQKQPYARIAAELSEQLIAEGIEVTTVNPPARELFSSTLAAPVDTGADGTPAPTNGQVGIDIAVVPRAISADPASTLASSFGCAPGWADTSAGDGTGETGGETGGDSGTEEGADAGGEVDTDGESGSPESTDSPDSRQGAERGAPIVPANPAAFCDVELQPEIEAALSGEIPLRQSLSAVEPVLWERAVAIPLFQLANTLAIGPGVSGVSAGPPMTGPFSSAVDWIRTPG